MHSTYTHPSIKYVYTDLWTNAPCLASQDHKVRAGIVYIVLLYQYYHLDQIGTDKGV